MLPFKGKQYTAKLVSKELGSIDQYKKLNQSDKAATGNTWISLLVSWQFKFFLPGGQYRSLSM